MNVTNPDTTKDFARLVELQQLFTESDAAFDTIQLTCDRKVAALLDTQKEGWAAAKVVRDQAEAEIKALVERHPEWKDGETVKTPFGSVQFRGGTKIEIPNPEATIAIIDSVYSKPESPWRPEQLVRTIREPNLETLEALDDSELQKLGCRRVSTQSITVKRMKVDLAKASKKKSGPKDVPSA